MRRRIRIRAKGMKDIVKEFEIPNKMHLDAQMTYKASVFEDRTKRIERKSKYKKTRPEHYDQ